MEWAAIVSAVLGIVALIIKHVLGKKDTRTEGERVADLGRQTLERSDEIKKEIGSGQGDSVSRHVDDLLSELDAIDRMRKTRGPNGK